MDKPVFKRKIYNEIREWKENRSDRYALLIKGARRVGKSTIAEEFAKKFGFVPVDTTDDGYELLALSFDGTKPRFGKNAKVQAIENQELTVYYSSQCPYIHQSVELVRKTCEELEAPCTLIPVDTLEKAKALPCVFNNWAVFYQGKFVTVNLLDAAGLKRLLKK